MAAMLRLTRLITLRSLHTRRLRTLLSMFGIILGVAGMLAIGATNQAAFLAVTNLFQTTSGKTDLEIHSADNAGVIPEATVNTVLKMPGVSAAVPVVKLQAALADKKESAEIGISFFGVSSGGLMLYGIDPRLDHLFRDYAIVSGRFISTDPNVFEIVLVADYAAENEVEVGDRVAIRTVAGPARLRVVGLMAKKGPGQINQGSFGVVSVSTAQKLKDQPEEIDQVDILAGIESSDPAVLEDLRLRLQERLGTEYTAVYPASQGQRMGQMLSGYQISLNFTGGIALFVGAFLIYNAFSMTVVERTREFGLLRAIGLTRRQIIVQVLIEGLVLGGFGSLLGVLLGIFMSRGLAQLMSTVLDQPIETVAVPPDIIATSILIGVFVTLLAAVLPAAQAGRISPLEALRTRGQSQGGWLMRFGFPVGLVLLVASAAILILNPFPYDVQYRLGSMVVFVLFIGAMLLIPATIGLWERVARYPFQVIYGSGGQIGARNLERARLRTMLTAAALLVGVSMIVNIQGMTASFATDLISWMEAYIGGDLYVNSSVPLKRSLQTRLESMEGVQAAVPIRYFDVTWQKADGAEETLNFMAIDPQAYVQVTRFLFSDPQTDALQAVNDLTQGRKVFISSVMSEKYHIKPGDALWLQTRSGLQPFEAVAVVMDFYNQGMVVTGNWEDMREYFHIDDATFILVKVRSGESIESTRDQIDALYGKRYQLTLDSNRVLKEQVLLLMDQAFSMFDVLGVIAVIVAAFGVVNTLTMSVIERTREIGMLRSIGMTRVQIVKMVLAEAGLLGVIGGLLGLIFGVVLTRIFLDSMAGMSGYKLSLVIPPETFWIGVVVALVVSQLAALLPALRAARTPVLEAIHYE